MMKDSLHMASSLSTPNVLTFLFFAFSTILVNSKTHNHIWEISYQFKSPDCLRKLVATINGQSPGPTINAQEGDTVIVKVTNKLIMENVAIHWHGIRQKGSPWCDGTGGISQCPIMPGETFVYKYLVDRAGTYMYHAHYGTQRSTGLYGMIVVQVPDGIVEPFSYDYEHSLIFNDWWLKSSYEQAVDLSSIPFVWIGEPQSLLINGRGRYNCSVPGTMGICNQTHDDCLPTVLTVIPGKTYRLRIASITSLVVLNLEIEGHNMSVVEADGHYVKPFTVSNLYIYSGETYSIILTANQDPSRNYWIAINIVDEPSETPTGTAILNYHPNRLRKPPSTIPPSGPLWNDINDRFRQSISIHSHPDHIHPPPMKSDRTILLLGSVNVVKGLVRFALNNMTLDIPHTPYLVSLKYKMNHAFNQNPPPETYDYKNYDIYGVYTNMNAILSSSVYRLKFNSTVDVVLQNTNTNRVNESLSHPWHMHGHNFWVLGYGKGRFDPDVDPKYYNLVDPIMKNTVPLHPYGWTAIRFRADNPGVWLFHCHVEAHLFMGMGIVFEEGIDLVEKLPKNIMGCGESKFIQD